MNLNNSFLVWKQLATQGLVITTRPMSERTIEDYEYYLNLLFKTGHNNILAAFLEVLTTRYRPDQYASREHLFKATVSYAKCLLEHHEITEQEYKNLLKYKPTRNKEPNRYALKDVYSKKVLMAAWNLGITPYTIVVVLMGTGMRASELCNLTYDCINFFEGTIKILGKGNKYRTIGLTKKVKACLLNYRKMTQRHHYVFVDKNGNKLTRHGVSYRLNKVSYKAGVKVTPHSLRRFFVTSLHKRGKPLSLLQLACGHSKIEITRNYCRVTEDDLIEQMKDW